MREYETILNVRANHMDMVKFSGAADYRYVQIKQKMDDVFDRLERRREHDAGMQNALIISE